MISIIKSYNTKTQWSHVRVFGNVDTNLFEYYMTSCVGSYATDEKPLLEIPI